MGAQSHGRWLDGVLAIGLRGLMEKLFDGRASNR
jgi:hypothetical protein